MPAYIVTVKYPKNPGHDPKNKRIGECPISPLCTDVTGEHHSFLMTVLDTDYIRVYAAEKGWHVTRVEQVGIQVDLITGATNA